LTIVKKIVEAHGGSISVKSKVGEGTTFEIVFPL
ncbi:MAG: HAMP domain-containing histidine kinase, partial [Methanomicrobia archaeon]|nr:HAMP domain-containing histidine kinase [Methanomicrobia archaeon]